MVYLEPVTVKTPFDQPKLAQRIALKDIYTDCKDMRLQVAAKVVERLRGEEFPHFEAARSTRSAWVRRHYMPPATVFFDVMLHETNLKNVSHCWNMYFLFNLSTQIEGILQ